MSILSLGGLLKTEAKKELTQRYVANLLRVIASARLTDSETLPTLQEILDPPKLDKRSSSQIIQDIIKAMEADE